MLFYHFRTRMMRMVMVIVTTTMMMVGTDRISLCKADHKIRQCIHDVISSLLLTFPI